MDGTALDDIKIHVKIKISALWVSVMLSMLRGFAPVATQRLQQGSAAVAFDSVAKE